MKGAESNMKINPIDFTLKDGRPATLCSPKPEDAEEMIRYMVRSTEETDFLLRYPEEALTYTVESERAFLESRNASEDELMITCYVQGKIAGNCALMRDSHINPPAFARFLNREACIVSGQRPQIPLQIPDRQAHRFRRIFF